MEAAVAAVRSRGSETIAFGERLEWNGSADDRKHATGAHRVDDIGFDLDVPSGAATLAGMPAAIGGVKRKAPCPHSVQYRARRTRQF